MIVLDQQPRNGSFGSGSIPVTAVGDNITLLGTMNQTDAANPALHCSGKILVSWDGLTYVGDPAWSFTWSGGIIGHDGVSFKTPSWGIGVPVDANGNRPQRVMGQLDTQGTTINQGLDLSVA